MDSINVELIGTSGDINWIQQSFETMMRTCDLQTMKEIVSHGTDDLWRDIASISLLILQKFNKH